jgi:hypothetical protein
MWAHGLITPAMTNRVLATPFWLSRERDRLMFTAFRIGSIDMKMMIMLRHHHANKHR